MTDKRKIIVALVIVGVAVLFVIMYPNALKFFLKSFDDALTQAKLEDQNKNATTTETATTSGPQVSLGLKVEKDLKSGYNVVAEVQNFLFYYGTPPKGTFNFSGVIGYGELSLDGKPVGRMYQPWFYIGDLNPGTHKIVVSLFKGDHSPLIQEGSQVTSTFTAIKK